MSDYGLLWEQHCPGCDWRSGTVASSEIGERLWMEHVHAEHPDRIADAERSLFNGNRLRFYIPDR